jgi:MFS family permease
VQVDGARGQSQRGIHQAAAAADAVRGAADAGTPGRHARARDRLPLWWLFFLPLYWFPQGINFGLIQTYLLCVLRWQVCRPSLSPLTVSGRPLRRPFQVEHIVGDARKQFFLSLMITSENFGSFFGPIWGALSDAAVGSDGRRRRRPIIVFGQCLFVGACVLMASAESFSVLLLSYMLFTFTATLSGAPYTVTNTTVPLEQRGVYNAMWSYQSLLMGFITSGLGAAVGEKYLSQTGAYAISYVVALFPTLPIGVHTRHCPPLSQPEWSYIHSDSDDSPS